jgi:hypothetical protein
MVRRGSGGSEETAGKLQSAELFAANASPRRRVGQGRPQLLEPTPRRKALPLMPNTIEGHWHAFRAALAAPDQPASTFLALQAIIRQEVGARLFTLMTFDARTGLSRRVHSSHPCEYPVSGVKPLAASSWSRTVVDERKTFVANTIEAIAEVFPDHELIASLGCGSVVNLPVVFNDSVIGIANALDARRYYAPKRVERMERLAPFITMALLAARLAAPKFEPSQDHRT